jgi:hypothetical protein
MGRIPLQPPGCLVGTQTLVSMPLRFYRGRGFVGLGFGQPEADKREERKGREEGKVIFNYMVDWFGYKSTETTIKNCLC